MTHNNTEKKESQEESKRESPDRGLAQILHDRARKSAVELRTLILSFSTAILAIYFLALTTKTEPELTSNQTIVCIVSVFILGLAVITGLISILADTKRNYNRAKALQVKELDERKRYFALRKKWLNRQRWSTRLLLILFSIGITGSVAYIIARTTEW